MIVEAIGPTASGKTTVLDAAAAELRARGVVLRTAHEVVLGPLDRRLPPAGPARALATQLVTLPSLALEVATHPRLALSLARVSWRHGERLSFRLNCLRNAVRRLAVAGAVRRANRRAPSGTVILIDEGLVHFVDMLAESRRAPTEAEVEAYIERLPPPDLVLRLRAPAGVRIARIQARGHRRLRSRDRASVEAYVAHGERATDLVAASPHLAGRVAVIETGDGAGNIAHAVESVCAAVQQALNDYGVGR